jgi:hypothetical protein
VPVAVCGSCHHALAQVQCCTDDGVWRVVARNIKGNTVKVLPPLPPLPAYHLTPSPSPPLRVKIRNLVDGKSYKFRLRCCFSSKDATAAAAVSLRDDAAEPEHLHWSAFGPPSDDFKARVGLRCYALHGCVTCD